MGIIPICFELCVSFFWRDITSRRHKGVAHKVSHTHTTERVLNRLQWDCKKVTVSEAVAQGGRVGAIVPQVCKLILGGRFHPLLKSAMHRIEHTRYLVQWVVTYKIRNGLFQSATTATWYIRVKLSACALYQIHLKWNEVVPVSSIHLGLRPFRKSLVHVAIATCSCGCVAEAWSRVVRLFYSQIRSL